jgi:cell division protein FtsQ
VAQVEMQVMSGGILEVRVVEREPRLIWRQGDELDLLDETGRRVARVLTRADRPDLPVITGEGANLATAEALEIMAAAEPVVDRVRGLVRVSDRRWDLVLDRDQRILLPAHEPVRALERLLALDKAEDLLNRDILSVDLRNPHRSTLRLAPNALRELRRAQGIETVENAL